MADRTTPARQSYAKAAATRAAILKAALAEFGAHGFAGATTRRIADRAGVALPAIAYHFGSKQGLYIACAEDIVARYFSHAAEMATAAGFALDAAVDPGQCRALLKQILRELLRIFVQTGEAQLSADFLAREMRERGPAFQGLYDRLWRPGVEITARLVVGTRGRSLIEDADRVDALMLISSLLAFHTGREVSLQILGWARLDDTAMARLDAAVDRLVDGIAL